MSRVQAVGSGVNGVGGSWGEQLECELAHRAHVPKHQLLGGTAVYIFP